MVRVKKSFHGAENTWGVNCPFCNYYVSYSERKNSIGGGTVTHTQDCTHSVAIKAADGEIIFLFDDQGLF